MAQTSASGAMRTSIVLRMRAGFRATPRKTLATACNPTLRGRRSLPQLRTRLALLFLLLPLPGAASSDPSDICELAALQASRDSGVPIDVMRAITLTETGRRHADGFRPWPWTVNMQGKGVWFDTPDEALAYVEQKYGTGARSFDVGCFQINYKWHGQAFASIAQMFEPAANARYAANLLRSLYGELGSWSAAAGAYHSRTPEFATRYRNRFDRIRARITGEPPDPIDSGAYALASPGADGMLTLPGQAGSIPEIPDIVQAMNGSGAQVLPTTPRINRYPLLQQSGPFAPVLGSLVPPSSGPTTALFGPDAQPLAENAPQPAGLTEAVALAAADAEDPSRGDAPNPYRLD